jgi:hypothetical protein
MKRCTCGATDVTATDHAVNIDGDTHVHAGRVACFIVEGKANDPHPRDHPANVRARLPR